jgi:hypothetical protein
MKIFSRLKKGAKAPFRLTGRFMSTLLLILVLDVDEIAPCDGRARMVEPLGQNFPGGRELAALVW